MIKVKRTTICELDNTWEDLKRASNEGILHSGDRIDITLKNGEDVTLVVGMDEKGNMFFSTQDCLRDEHRMNNAATNRGGWEATEMRRYLNEDVFALFPDELQAVIRPTTIVQIVDGKRVETQDKLFLFSATQVFGSGSYSENEPEDTQLDIFRREKDRVKECNAHGTWFWWLRSANSSSINNFCYANYGGNRSYYSAYDSCGVALGFSI